MKLEARITLAMPIRVKEELDLLARKSSVSEERNITNGELIRRAIDNTYGIKSKSDTLSRARQNNRKKQKY
jgi:hypothetical protein